MVLISIHLLRNPQTRAFGDSHPPILSKSGLISCSYHMSIFILGLFQAGVASHTIHLGEILQSINSTFVPSSSFLKCLLKILSLFVKWRSL